MEWKELLKNLKLEHFERTAPGFFEQSGGHRMKVKPYSDATANGLTRCICDFIRHIGGYANRISTTGTMRKINGQMKWTRGNSNKGAADIRILFNGRSVDVEVKVGRDRMREAQTKEKERVERAGGLYFVARSFPEFLEWWLQLFPLSISSLKRSA
ncbi:MAG: hypothetical protein ACO1OO_08550 [Flavisolibacter sp.]